MLDYFPSGSYWNYSFSLAFNTADHIPSFQQSSRNTDSPIYLVDLARNLSHFLLFLLPLAAELTEM